jgi:hypothetical protein
LDSSKLSKNNTMNDKCSVNRQVEPLNLQQETWRVFQIMAEFVEGFEELSSITPSVSMFGSARFAADNPYCRLAEEIARDLSDAGFSVVTGGGPSIMEAANKGMGRKGARLELLCELLC